MITLNCRAFVISACPEQRAPTYSTWLNLLSTLHCRHVTSLNLISLIFSSRNITVGSRFTTINQIIPLK